MTSQANAPNPGAYLTVILALALGAFAIGSAEFSAMSLLPFYANDLGLTEPVAAHAISAYAIGVVVGAPLIALLAARYSRRSMLVTLMLVFSACNLATFWASSYETMVLLRFLSGIPHGAYFGLAALMAASLAPARRAQSVSFVMSGLTIATVIGASGANWLALSVGWRWGFVIVAAVALLTAVSVRLLAPVQPPEAGLSIRMELSALRAPQIWLTLGAGAIGFGGLFAIYSFLGPIMTQYTGESVESVPLMLVVFGVGMTVGNLAAGWLADRALKASAVAFLLWSTAVLALFPLLAGNVYLLAVGVFAVGLGGGISSILQTRLMDVSGDAQTISAALHHAAFNVANALGPWLAGMAIARGQGWTSPGWVGALLAFGGLLIVLLSFYLERRQPRKHIQSGSETCHAMTK